MSIYAADFEATSNNDYQLDGYTRVYLWAIQDIEKTKPITGNTIEEFIGYLATLDSESTVFFHNLAYDGLFILDHLFKRGWTLGTNPFQLETVIGDNNVWYSIKLHYPNCDIFIKDSMKKFPMSLEDLAKTLGIEGKTELDFDKRRGPDYIPTRSEIVRCSRDVKILAHALNETFKQGMDADTTSADAMNYFKRTLVASPQKNDTDAQRLAFKRLFPKVLKAQTDPEFENLREIEKILRDGYYGGLTFVNPKYQNKVLENVSVYDRNSMYPAVMVHHPMPYGRIKNRDPGPDDLYVIQIDASFKLKPGHLPFIQNKCGIFRDADVIYETDESMCLVLPSPLYELFHENYEVENEKILNRWVFAAKYGIFDQHIKHFMNIKANTTNAGERMLAKLRLNGLYGKFGQDPDRTNKYPVLENDHIAFKSEKSKGSSKSTYLPVAMFTTAWAKYDLIKAAEKFGDRFIYCDTDSIHVIHQEGDENLLPIDPKKLGYWKHENTFEIGKYLRSKMYIHGHRENGKNIVDEIKAAGLPEAARGQITFENLDFDSEFEGKLVRKTVPGGCVLVPVTYKIRGGVITEVALDNQEKAPAENLEEHSADN